MLLQREKQNNKTGQAVKIRAVLLTPEGKPYDEQIDIVIMVGVLIITLLRPPWWSRLKKALLTSSLFILSRSSLKDAEKLFEKCKF